MRKLILAFAFVLVILAVAGCTSKCDKPKVSIGSSCCIDSNNNKICDTDEVKATEQKAAENTTTHTNQTIVNNTVNQTVPIKLDCSNTKLFVARAVYRDGGNSSITAIFSNTGKVNITGIKVLVYNDYGKKIEKSFSANLSASSAHEFSFKTGDYNIVNENASVTMMKFSPLIKDHNDCNYTTVMAPDINVMDKS